MIQLRSILKVADNTGAKRISCFHVFGGYKKRYGHVGDIITVAIKEAAPRGLVKKGEIAHAVIVRQHKEFRRPDGTYLRFDDNAAVLIDKKTKEPRGTRIFGPVARELRDLGFQKIISLASEVV